MRMRLGIVLCLALALAGCAGGGGGGDNPAPPLPPPPPTAPAFDFGPFLAPSGASLTAPVGTAWVDYGGYQWVTHFWLPDGSAVAAWLYAPWTKFDQAEEAGCPGSPCRGDGGEHYVVDADGTLRVDSTQDGGKLGVQYFTGKGCGGTGWIVARSDIDASWHSVLALLDDHPAPTPCTAGSPAWTRYTLRPITVPNLGTRRAIISEHYNGLSPAMAANMERLFLIDGGPARIWQKWGPQPPTVDLSQRAVDFGWSTPPVAGWHLEDVRENVNPQPTALTGHDFWHPP